ncbi:ubiquitin fusion degradation protein [Grosmannia clavigera kw1407]|uniref:Ubiquitin fusion degradation protein n=1 Tax=Grosmannia clavigera (strain kw1407 / UAMH 11150) TaxID=655863 RepID=F0XP70_GROCL|nr:ubiquitin fusion degradation protein [Grosmannia clavigera kw1407]EFX00533.1 ubiquitin fusion degradation protein [Grosmannia clavigera kw1407]
MDDGPSGSRIHYKDVFTAVPAAAHRPLQGDKILLPPSALQTLLDAAARAQLQAGSSSNSSGDLPQPLTFRLVNTANQRAVFAGIREFSADEGHVVLSPYLRAALGVEDDEDGGDNGNKNHLIAVAFAPLPKGTFVHLRPLEAGYNPADWRALLERQLREAFTTLTRNALLTVRGSTADETFHLRIDGFQPATDGICVVDTDLEVDIEALDEQQALETARQIQARKGSSEGGTLDIFRLVQGRVLAGDYVDYELPAWDRSRPLQISLSDLLPSETDEEAGYAVDLLISPRSPRQRALPRETEHVWANFGLADATGAKTITIAPSAVELEDAEALLVTVHGWKGGTASSAASYSLRARVVLEEEAVRDEEESTKETAHDPTEEQCQNCRQWVPSRTMVLHESFCRRNNAACQQCGHVFPIRSAAWQNHWHCTTDQHDGGQGDSAASQTKHDAIFHQPRACPAETCSQQPLLSSLPVLARHRTTTCPAKRILCQFCHLEVAQEGDAAESAVEAATAALTGMTPHERVDGARTTECYLCDAIVRMRDMRAHLQHHALDRQRRPPPPVCRNVLCSRTRYGVGARGVVRVGGPEKENPLGLCASCFAPLYVSTHDPDGRVLHRRLERRYLGQLLTGCGHTWCSNVWCKTGRQNRIMAALAGPGAGSAALLPLVRPLVDEATAQNDDARPLHLCVDEASQQRRAVAEMLAAQGRYDLAWCMAACEAEGPDATKAWSWLSNWAPEKGTEA